MIKLGYSDNILSAFVLLQGLEQQLILSFRSSRLDVTVRKSHISVSTICNYFKVVKIVNISICEHLSRDLFNLGIQGYRIREAFWESTGKSVQPSKSTACVSAWKLNS